METFERDMEDLLRADETDIKAALERKNQYKTLSKRRGRELVGVTKRGLGEMLILDVNVTKAQFKGKPYKDLSAFERQEYEDLLYISHIQEGNVQFVYSA